MSTKMFVNLPVKDLDRSVDFFTQLGFEFNPQFTDQNATCMIVGPESFVMLLVEDFFSTLTTKALCDASTHAEAIIALSADSRERVDELADKALAASGHRPKEATEQPGMYGRSFSDLDGHLWELLWMDPAAMGR